MLSVLGDARRRDVLRPVGPLELHQAFWLLLIETAIYSPLVVGYFLAVMHFMADFLTDIYGTDLRLYAGISVGLLIGQSLFLDGLVGLMMRWAGLKRV